MDASEAPVKRCRGGPPKNGVSAQPKKAPSSRPRGRPPGTGGGVKKATAKKPAKASTSAPERRGRQAKAASTSALRRKLLPRARSPSPKAPLSRDKSRKSDVEEPQEDKVDAEEAAASGFLHPQARIINSTITASLYFTMAQHRHPQTVIIEEDDLDRGFPH